jgi:putative phage-type endonuclease
MLTPEQLLNRKSGIGGSDAAAVVGQSPWKTATEVYYEKRDEITQENIDDKEYVHFGNVLEQVVADEYARRTDQKVQKRNEMVRHEKYPFLLANIDRKVVGARKGLECKTADKFTRGKWGAHGSDEAPEYYIIQCAHYMNVLDYPEWDLAVLIGGNEYRHYHIKRDADLSEMLIEHCVKFWDRVQKGLEPDIDYNHQSAIGMVKRLYPGTNGQTITLPDDLSHWHKVRLDAEEEVKRYTSVVEACKARIMKALQDNAVGIIPGSHFQYKRSEVKKKEFTVAATSYFQMRGSKWSEKM